jgi:serine/threonine protein kinase
MQDSAATQIITANGVIDGNTETWVMAEKGESIAGGATGFVERLPSGDAVKSPWPSRFNDNHKAMITEAQIYNILGAHPRLIKIVNWDSETCCLTMEYMPNGNLIDYLQTYNDEISTSQRLQWILEAAEGLQLLHSADIIHRDMEPRNLLLSEDLSLRISDFSRSSIQGAQPMAHAGTRFSQPTYDWRYRPTVQDDLFAFGSTIYTIITGVYPFQEIDSTEVIQCYEAQDWPNVTGIPCGEIIEQCWRCEIASAQEIYDTVLEKIKVDKIGASFPALSP